MTHPPGPRKEQLGVLALATVMERLLDSARPQSDKPRAATTLECVA